MADYSLADVPTQRQALVAELLRRRMQAAPSQELVQANEQASALDPLAAISQMANNPELAHAAAVAQKAQQTRFTPEKLGQQGFMLPGTGQFVESPIYTAERQAQRDAIAENQVDRLNMLRQAQQDRLDAASERARDRSSLQETLARMADATRRSEGASNRSLRLTLADAAAEQRRLLAESRVADKTDHDEEMAVRKLDDTANRRGIPRLMTAARTVSDAILQAEKNKQPVPGLTIGSKLAAKYLPFLVDDDAARVTSAVQEITNAMLKADSGLNVTAKEELRKATEQMQADNIPEARRRQILKERILPMVNVYRSTTLGAFPAQVRARYAAGQQQVGGDTSWMDSPLPFSTYMPELPAGEQVIGKRLAK